MLLSICGTCPENFLLLSMFETVQFQSCRMASFPDITYQGYRAPQGPRTAFNGRHAVVPQCAPSPACLLLQEPEASVDQLGVSNVHQLQRMCPSGAPIFSLAEGPDYYPPGAQKERTRDSQGGGQALRKQVFTGNADKTIVAWSPPEYSTETKVRALFNSVYVGSGGLGPQ